MTLTFEKYKLVYSNVIQNRCIHQIKKLLNVIEIQAQKNCIGDFNYYFSILHSVDNFYKIIEAAMECLVHANDTQIFTQ